jgi:hypothetical protein
VIEIVVIVLVTLFVDWGQDEGFEASETSTREFLGLLESPLHDLALKKASATNWLAQCEQALQQAAELVDPAAPSGLVIGYSTCD